MYFSHCVLSSRWAAWRRQRQWQQKRTVRIQQKLLSLLLRPFGGFCVKMTIRSACWPGQNGEIIKIERSVKSTLKEWTDRLSFHNKREGILSSDRVYLKDLVCSHGTFRLYSKVNILPVPNSGSAYSVFRFRATSVIASVTRRGYILSYVYVLINTRVSESELLYLRGGLQLGVWGFSSRLVFIFASHFDSPSHSRHLFSLSVNSSQLKASGLYDWEAGS